MQWKNFCKTIGCHIGLRTISDCGSQNAQQCAVHWYTHVQTSCIKCKTFLLILCNNFWEDLFCPFYEYILLFSLFRIVLMLMFLYLFICFPCVWICVSLYLIVWFDPTHSQHHKLNGKRIYFYLDKSSALDSSSSSSVSESPSKTVRVTKI